MFLGRDVKKWVEKRVATITSFLQQQLMCPTGHYDFENPPFG